MCRLFDKYLDIVFITIICFGIPCELSQCNLKNGQCVYDTQLGHEGQCDSVSQRTGGGHISGSCSCDDVWRVTNQMQNMKSAESDLTQMMAELQQYLNNATAELNNVNGQLNLAQQNTSRLQTDLNTKEKTLNQTKVNLNSILQNANTELTTLRENLVTLNRNISSCQTALGTPLSTHSALSDHYTTFFCGFEPSNVCGFTQDKTDNTDWYRSHVRESTSTGPHTDHTYGNGHGYYMVLKASSPYRSSSGTTEARLISPSFDPAPQYCVRFWYNMYGKDVKTFNVYAMVHGGMGYPVFSQSGNIDNQWHMAEVSLDKEYTGEKFQVVFEATTTSYRVSHYHSGGHYTYDYYNEQGNIAIDDVVIYNTSCAKVPAHPDGSVTRKNGNTTSYYTFHTTPKSWYNAVDVCKKENSKSNLVKISDATEQAFLVSVIQGDIGLTTAGQSGFYTNGNDYDNEGNYKWTSTGYPQRITYLNWHPGQPNNVGDNQDCVLMQYPESNYEWGDVTCTEPHPFICETEI